MLASTKEFALASCIDKALNLKLGGFTHKEMDKTLRKYGKKSDCKIVKEGERLEENLIAVIRGRLADGTYTLFIGSHAATTAPRFPNNSPNLNHC